MHVVVHKIPRYTFAKYKFYTTYTSPFSSSWFKKGFSNWKEVSLFIYLSILWPQSVKWLQKQKPIC